MTTCLAFIFLYALLNYVVKNCVSAPRFRWATQCPWVLAMKFLNVPGPNAPSKQVCPIFPWTIIIFPMKIAVPIFRQTQTAASNSSSSGSCCNVGLRTDPRHRRCRYLHRAQPPQPPWAQQLTTTTPAILWHIFHSCGFNITWVNPPQRRASSPSAGWIYRAWICQV